MKHLSESKTIINSKKMTKNITIIGIGHIGSSIAVTLKKRMNCIITAVDFSKKNLQFALENNIVDKVSEMNECFANADFVFLCIPVKFIEDLLPEILNNVDNNTVVIDVGSTKKDICQKIRNHKNRKQFVAAHPIAGTEYNGPQSAIEGLFDNKMNLICESELSEKSVLEKAKEIFSVLKMNTKFIDADEHDKNLAYVSHLSHVLSFALANTVINNNNLHSSVFTLAGSGFASTVRLAKSSPEMWIPIFLKNSENILQALDIFIDNLLEYKSLIQNSNSETLNIKLTEANEIKNLIDLK